MKVCVFGAASALIDESYIVKTEHLGETAAKRGHSLVFGAGGSGLMGAAARGFKRGGGHIHGVIPEFFREETIEVIYDGCDELTYTADIFDRKRQMEDDAQAFIIVPGGIGTFDEFFEILTLKQLARHNKPIAVYNIDGYYDELEAFMRTVAKEKFMSDNCFELYRVCASEKEIFDYIENEDRSLASAREFKRVD